jgi:SAM-dependent methyltransferase
MSNVFAPERLVTNAADCIFYHTMEIPGHGLVEGEWDLRADPATYLGNVDLRGKRVLEVGTASGFLCYYMERQGADVVAFDLSEEQSWDLVPYARSAYGEARERNKKGIRRHNNGWWFAHRAFESRAKVVYGTVYEIPSDIGLVDICTFCSVLLHVRDPFLALESALRLTRDTVIITELRPVDPDRVGGPFLRFKPEFRKGFPPGTWWDMSPAAIQEFIGVLGFEQSEVKYHQAGVYSGKARALYTVVGRRTVPLSTAK